MDSNKLSPDQAYLAMFAFLDAYYRSTHADDVGALLGSLSLMPDGKPADPAVRGEWTQAVEQALKGQVDAAIGMRP